MARLKKKLFNYLLKYQNKTKVENCYITCSGRNDGLGAQVQAILSTILISKQYNITYVHTPFIELEHTSGEEEKFEKFFNLGANHLSMQSLDISKLNIVNIKHPYEIKKEENTLYITQSCHDYADKYPDSYLNIIERISTNFIEKNENNYKSHYKENKLNVALHVRRGDVSNNKNIQRFTGNEFYKNFLDELSTICCKINIDLNINLYSHGTISDFNELKDFNINYYLNDCLETTFYNLVTSDLLIMSKSSLSYCAALMSKGIIIYQPFWHKPLSGWNIINNTRESDLIDDVKLLKSIIK